MLQQRDLGGASSPVPLTQTAALTMVKMEKMRVVTQLWQLAMGRSAPKNGDGSSFQETFSGSG